MKLKLATALVLLIGIFGLPVLGQVNDPYITRSSIDNLLNKTLISPVIKNPTIVGGTSTGTASGGTQPTVTGGGGTCAGGATVGGVTNGTLTLTGACAATNTITLSAFPAAPNGWGCDATDRTSSATVVKETSTSVTTAVMTVSGTTSGATDVIQYNCHEY